MKSKRCRRFGVGAVALLTSLGPLAGLTPLGAAESPILSGWFQAQTNLNTWTAKLTQIRSLKTLAQPLVTHGQVWIAAPNRFRWELGHPPTTIAVRQTNQLLVIYPKLQRAERYRWESDQTGPWKESLALLEAGFPREPKEFRKRFQLLEEKDGDGQSILVFQPRAPGARRMIARISIEFSSADSSLRASELHFADGSRLRNEFRDAQLNLPLPEELFNPTIDPEFQIVDPLGASEDRSAP